MKPLLPALLIGCLALAPIATQAAMPQTVGQRALSGYIQPATQRLLHSGEALDTALSSYCAKPAEASRRQRMEQGFGNFAEAWGRVEILRFGPLLQDNRFERMFFFPDPRGVTQRQVQALLAAADPQALTATALRARSVAVQGLPALELALYDGDAATRIASNDAAGRYRCRYAQAVTAGLRDTAAELATAWADGAPYARTFAHPSADAGVYRNAGEVATEIVKALSTGLQYTRDVKLLPALGAEARDARGQRAPLWRSGLTTRALASSASGLIDFYRASGLGQALPADDRWIDDSLVSEGAVVLADLHSVALPFQQAVADVDGERDILIHAALVLKNQQAIVVEYLAPALNVPLGFNALDGD